MCKDCGSPDITVSKERIDLERTSCQCGFSTYRKVKPTEEEERIETAVYDLWQELAYWQTSQTG